jgi:hypothetical protein
MNITLWQLIFCSNKSDNFYPIYEYRSLRVQIHSLQFHIHAHNVLIFVYSDIQMYCSQNYSGVDGSIDLLVALYFVTVSGTYNDQPEYVWKIMIFTRIMNAFPF